VLLIWAYNSAAILLLGIELRRYGLRSMSGKFNQSRELHELAKAKSRLAAQRSLIIHAHWVEELAEILTNSAASGVDMKALYLRRIMPIPG
jgi:hypothetical protein